MIDFSLPVNLYLYSAIAIVSIGVVALFNFRSQSVKSVRMRIILFILRGAGLAILLLILANPVRQQGEEHSKAQTSTFFLLTHQRA